jgi:hypothetical protein
MAVTASPGAGRVLVALSDGPLVAEPTWTRYDTLTDCRCYGYDCSTGRQSELDTTDTGTATVFFHDRTGVLDDDDLIGLQIMLQLYNPVLAEWEIRWRGHIDDIEHDLVDAPLNVPLANVAFRCVGIFDYLGGVKFLLDGSMGDAGGPDGVVFYEDEPVDDRIIALHDDAGLDVDMYITFSGNVDVNETLYDPDDVILTGLRDAADAEFPGVANIYEDRFGRSVFHGRFARFDPEATEATEPTLWDFTRWEAATREDVTSGIAQIRAFAFNRPRARIINSYHAWPREDENGLMFDRALLAGLQKSDPTSITAYGYRGQEAPDLIIKQHKTNGNTGADECELFGEFYIQNYAQPRKAIQTVVFKSIATADARAAATWDLMCRCDISDIIQLTVDEASLANEPFFVDGISIECRPLNPTYDLVTFTPNLTPASYYGTDVFSGT